MSGIRRRTFLHHAAWSAMGVATPLGLNLGAITQAAAQTSGTYRALVCLFMNGGNDAFNTVLATDESSWQHYLNHRQTTGDSSTIALPRSGTAPDTGAAAASPSRLGGVLPISHAGRAVHAGRAFALHPALGRTQQMYQAGRVAVLANVGPLTRPTNKADWADARVRKPSKLFSHNDQQSTWQTFHPEGASAGWGGLMADLLMSGNGIGVPAQQQPLVQRSFTCMAPTSAATWLAGRVALPFQTSASNVLSLGSNGQVYGQARLHAALANIMGRLHGSGQPAIAPTNLFASDKQKIVQRALEASELIGPRLPALGTGPWSTSGISNASADPLLQYISPKDGSLRFNPLAQQLQMVARLIDTNRTAGLGMSRQLFMVNVGGFDTHDNQVSEHAERLAQIDHALAYFDAVLGGMPGGDMRNNVTTFTASEFGRTFTSNGDGTDHGWGGHHFVMGGAVRGTEVYGRFPQYSTASAQGEFSSPDQIQNGSLIPSTSVDQYAYTLGKWMGVSDSNLRAIMPNLAQFDASGHDLGFMQA